MKYNNNEVTGKMRDRIILQNVNRSRSLTGFASESWADVATIWAFAESKLPGSNETIIEGKNTAKNICDFTIRYISLITEESRVVFKNKIYQVKNIKISHDRRFISFQGVYYDSYSTVFGLQLCSASLLAQSSLSAALMRVINFQSSLAAFGTVTADINFVQKVASSLNTSSSLISNLQLAKNVESSIAASSLLNSDLKIAKTFESSLNANGTLVSNATIAKILASSLTSSNSLAANALVSKLASALLTGAGTTTANLTVNAPSAGLLLDLYPSAAAAYSLRKLRTAYTGNAVRVRRSSDNTEQDIGFVAGQLDTTSLLAFCGVGNGFVTTWYDQSGNARNATQSTQANQPQIVSSGSLILENGKVSVSYDGTNDTLISSAYNFGATSYSGFVVSKSGGLNNIGRSIYTIKPKDLIQQGYLHLLCRDNIINKFRSYYSSDGQSLNFLIQTPLNVFPTTQNLISNIVPTSGNITFNLNSIQQDSDLAIGQTLNNTIFLIGNYYDAPLGSQNYYHQGTISELIIYMSNQQSNRTGIESNINTHYAIY